MSKTDRSETAAPAVGPQVERPVRRPAPKRAAQYRLRYLCDSYTLADAFRPQPGWGSRGYTVDAAALGEHTDADVVDAALQTAPQGYWLQRVEAIGGEPHIRTVWSKPVPHSKTPNVRGEAPAAHPNTD